MAKPKVFISSTCYDLSHIRDALCTFIKSFGFEPVLSENGDIFFHPDIHTHDACINEISNCQLFILIIGGRFGGKYISDKTKSITNAEYEAASQLRLPIFTYIKRNVLENHHLYQENKDQPFINEFKFPAIDNQTDAVNIFNFINKVRKSSINNAYEPFEFISDIEEHLRKQWASMFFDFLKNREISLQIDNTSKSVNSLVITTDKLESLVKSLYLSLDKREAPDAIELIQQKSMAKAFLHQYINSFYPGFINADSMEEIEELAEIDPNMFSWHEYLSKITLLERDDSKDGIHYYTNIKLDDDVGNEHMDWSYGLEISDIFPTQNEMAYLYQNGMCKLNKSIRAKILQEFSHLKYLL